MKFVRTLGIAKDQYRTVCLPKCITDDAIWKNASNVEMTYDPLGNTIMIKPMEMGKNG